MIEEEFWPAVWAISDLLALDPDDEQVDVDALRGLFDDLAIQRVVFVDHSWARSEWFEILREEGLFSSPPSLVHEGDTFRATAWPAMEYLNAVASEFPAQTAEILLAIDSDNWWVVSDGLRVASRLPPDHAAKPILHLIQLWQGLPVQWTHPDTFVEVLEKLARTENGGRRVEEALSRIVWALLEERRQKYDLEEVVRSASDQLSPELRFHVADSIENALSSRVASGISLTSSFTRLIDLESGVRGWDDAMELLVKTWLSIAEHENKNEGPSSSLTRATRLLATSDGLLRQMGLRALSLTLSQNPHDSEAVGLITALVKEADLLTGHSTLAEAKSILQKYWGSISVPTQAFILKRLVSMAEKVSSEGQEATEEASAYLVRDWLHWLADYLGPVERALLSDLTSRLGAPIEDLGASPILGGFAGSKGPVDDSALRRMSVEEIVTLMRFPPGARPDEWLGGASPEGLGMQVKTLVPERLDEFIPLFEEIADNVKSGSILYQFILGLTETFKDKDRQNDARLSAVVEFLAVVAKNALANRLADEEFYRSSTVLGAAADFFRDLASWTAPRLNSAALEVLKAALQDPNPSTPKDDEDDPFGVALNTTRGKALLAVLELLAQFWGSDAIPSSEARQELESFVRQAGREERHPGVRSAFGLYLPSLVFYWEDFWQAEEETILPTSVDRASEWSAAFVTYFTHNRPHLKVAPTLRPHYSLASVRLGSSPTPSLKKFASHLISHLLALSLASPETWLGLVVAALEGADDEAAARGISALVRPKRNEADDIPRDWIEQLVKVRLASMRARPEKRPQELRAFAELIVATNYSPASIGGAFLDLLGWGGVPRGDELIEYLRGTDAQRTQLGGQILAEAVKQGAFDAFLREEGRLPELIREYSPRSLNEMRGVINYLGRKTRIPVEEVAREIYAVLERSSGAEGEQEPG